MDRMRRSAVKRQLQKLLPTLAYSTLESVYRRLPGTPGWRRLRNQAAAVDRLAAQGGYVVRHGTFAGLRYGRFAPDVPTVSKLLGCYEEELQPAFERLLTKGYSRVVNVGCAEGYYAVGLALRLPDARVFAFDTSEEARRRCKQLALINGVADRVEVGSTCGPERLASLADAGTLIVVDCEGCEARLLRSNYVDSLRCSDMIIELHDFLNGSISTGIIDTFVESHRVTLCQGRERLPATHPALERLRPEARAELVDEGRAELMQWAVLEAVDGFAE